MPTIFQGDTFEGYGAIQDKLYDELAKEYANFYIDIDDKEIALDGRFNSKQLRMIADALYHIEKAISITEAQEEQCTSCHNTISALSDRFRDDKYNVYCTNCAMSLTK